MAKAKRNIGREILDGLREIKRGKHGRVVNVPDAAHVRLMLEPGLDSRNTEVYR